MANVLIVLLVVVVGVAAWSLLQRRRASVLPRRGSSVGADLGALSDQPRVRVEAVAALRAGRTRVILTPVAGTDSERLAPGDLDLVVLLREDEFGFGLLGGWQRSGSPLAIVIPPGSRLVRLRSIDDLQPLTLRRADDARN